MTAKEVLDTIKLMFVETSTTELSNETVETVETKMAEAKLVDGTTVYTSGDLEEGATLYIKTEDGEEDPMAPSGQHMLQDEKTLITVGENGVIEKIETVEEEMKDEDEMKEHSKKEKEEMSSEEFANELTNAIKPLIDEIATLKNELATLTERFEKVANEPASKKIRNNFSQDEKASNFDSRFETLLRIKNGN